MPSGFTRYNNPFGGQPGDMPREEVTHQATHSRGSGVDLSWESIEDVLQSRPINGSSARSRSLNATPVTLQPMRHQRATGFEHPVPPMTSRASTIPSY